MTYTTVRVLAILARSIATDSCVLDLGVRRIGIGSSMLAVGSSVVDCGRG